MSSEWPQRLTLQQTRRRTNFGLPPRARRRWRRHDDDMDAWNITAAVGLDSELPSTPVYTAIYLTDR